MTAIAFKVKLVRTIKDFTYFPDKSQHRLVLSTPRSAMLQLLKRLLSWPNTLYNHDVNHLNPKDAVSTLPMEIHLAIADFLPPSDAACLALCNRKLAARLGASSWLHVAVHVLHGARQEREDFLQRISRDIPPYFYCHKCSYLHRCTHVLPPVGRFVSPLRCVRDSTYHDMLLWATHTHLGTTYYEFTFHHLQLAMLRHRYGSKHGMPIDSLHLHEIEETKYDQTTTLFPIDARIVDDELCLRIQQWLLLSPDLTPTLESVRRIGICSHIMKYSDSFKTLIQAKLDHSEANVQLPAHSKLLKCAHCETEFEISIEMADETRKVVLVTKWLSLGNGTSPNDHRCAGTSMSASTSLSVLLQLNLQTG
jgi:hypothetical protein